MQERTPILWYQLIRGKSKPIVTVFDSGCSSTIVRDDIPGLQLRAAPIPTDNSILMGIGGNQETSKKYGILLPLIDGSSKMTEAHAVRNLVDIPELNLSNALEQVKRDAIDKREVQEARVHQRMGGGLDLLIGIKCLDIFPVPVHETKSGLGIYKLMLESHDPSHKYCLGGSYSHMEKFPTDPSSILSIIEKFQNSLLVFMDGKFLNSHTKNLVQTYNSSRHSLYCTTTKRQNINEREEIIMGLAKPRNKSSVEQLKYGDKSHTSKTSKFKKSFISELERILLGDLNTDYRCENCMGCLTCKQGESEEMMSISEGLEETTLRNSITFDDESKKFTARLPVQGDVSKLLSTNREMAENSIRRTLAKLVNREKDIEQIKTSFNKLLDKGFITKINDLPEQNQIEISGHNVQHYIPWVLAYKEDSKSTPVRICFDASRRTPSGKSLNMVLPKGRNDLSLERMAINFAINRVALVGDISKFYNRFNLDPRDWNLQLILWQDDFDPHGPLSTYVIKTLIYGIKSVARHTEIAMDLLSKKYKNENPEIYRLLTNCRYVDDLSSSVQTIEEAEKLRDEADKLLSSVGMVMKGWTLSGSKPDLELANDGKLGVGGYNWDSLRDTISLKVPAIHFGKKVKGKVGETVSIFEGNSKAELDDFTPRDITFRQVTSRLASLFDTRGLVSPLISDIKLLLRETGRMALQDWEFKLNSDLRSKWISALWVMEQLKPLEFQRCTIPSSTTSTQGHLSIFTDSSAVPKSQQVAYISFPLQDGTWSKQLLIARNQLGPEGSKIPNMELEALKLGAVLGNKLTVWLEGYVSTRSLCSDSEISLHWVRNENRRLATFQRNRVREIKRLFKNEEIYHVAGKDNPADVGTRKGVTIQDVDPNSKFYKGPDFLSLGLEGMIEKNFLRPIGDLVQQPKENADYQDGLVRKSEDIKELFIGVVNLKTTNRLIDRYQFSNYIMDPLKFSWNKTIRIISLAFLFLKKLLLKMENRSSLFTFTKVYNNIFIGFNKGLIPLELFTPKESALFSYRTDKKSVNTNDSIKYLHSLMNSNTDFTQISLAVGWYFLRLASSEAKHFCPKNILQKHATEKHGILLSNNRWSDSCEIQDNLELDFDAPKIEIRSEAPFMDRFSPIATAIAKHIHSTEHRGSVFCRLKSLNYLEIYQGQRLFDEISKDCIKCKIRFKKRMYKEFGKLHPTQLTIGHVMAVSQADMSGPYETKTHLQAKNTRGRPSTTKLWVLHTVCCMSHVSHSLVMEDCSTDSFLSALTRLSCIYGIPRTILIDPSSSEMCGLINAKVTIKDPIGHITMENGIRLEVCGVGGQAHARHGLVEKRIHMVKETVKTHWDDLSTVSILAFQGLLEQTDNILNSTPLGFSQCLNRSASSTLVTPNHFRMGRSNNRTIGAPLQLPETRGIMLKSATSLAEALVKYITYNAIPQMLIRPKWLKGDRDQIAAGDLVLFQKRTGPINSNWKIGRVEGKEAEHIVELRYGNASEIILPLTKKDKLTPTNSPHFTRRDVRTLVKLYNVDDPSMNSDLAYIRKWYEEKQSELNKKDDNHDVAPSSNKIQQTVYQKEYNDDKEDNNTTYTTDKVDHPPGGSPLSQKPITKAVSRRKRSSPSKRDREGRLESNTDREGKSHPSADTTPPQHSMKERHPSEKTRTGRLTRPPRRYRD